MGVAQGAGETPGSGRADGAPPVTSRYTPGMGRYRVHLDTDIGGDADDLCALAMLLGSPDVDLVAITTCIEQGGQRADMARTALALGGWADIPVIPGRDTLFDGSAHDFQLQDSRYWPAVPIERALAGRDATEVLAQSIASGACVIAIGPLTDLALAERNHPGLLRGANIVAMGGHVEMPGAGLPQWGPAMNFNFEADAPAARVVFGACDPLIVPLHVCMPVAVREEHLERLGAGGPLSRLVGSQCQLHGRGNDMAGLAAACPGLPHDILNFQWDPVACGAALGWDCVRIEERPLALVDGDGGMVFVSRAGDPARRVVTAVDADAFNEEWLACVSRV